jgi:hypothetical protein
MQLTYAHHKMNFDVLIDCFENEYVEREQFCIQSRAKEVF